MKKNHIILIAILLVVASGIAYYTSDHGHDENTQAEHGDEHGHNDHAEEEQKKGPHGGKLFRDDDFAVEITIFEDGVPPQFRVYAYDDDEPIDPSKVELAIELHRLDSEVNRFAFTAKEDVLVGDGVVLEPHSFDVKVQATYDGDTHQWEFDSYEGRVEISQQAAEEAGVTTEKAGAATIKEYARLTGRVTVNRNTTVQIRARFPGIVRSVNAMWGQQVKKGDVLATIESNDSLKNYHVTSPVDGVILARNTNIGDVAGDESLFTVADLTQVWAEFHVFPTDLPKVKQGQTVRVHTLGNANDENYQQTEAPLSMLLPTADANSQTVLAIVALNNSEGIWRPGMTVKGEALIAEKQVPLAVKTSALQKFRDFTVVFAKFGDMYEVRMLELGTRDSELVEVLGGLKPGTEYATQNSFLIKADIEKSGASHDH